nr:Chain B, SEGMENTATION PROTEIN FUSHI TARAZU [Drosophila melanogaster]
STLRALLTN